MAGSIPCQVDALSPAALEDCPGDLCDLVRGAGLSGAEAAEGIYVLLARIFMALYFLFFLLMPFYTRGESTSRVPERVTFDTH